MTYAAFTPIDADRLFAALAQGRLWLLEIVAWIADCFGDGRIGRALRAGLVRDLQALRRGVAGVLVLLAMRRLPASPPRRPQALRPAHAPRGFRAAGRAEPMRGAMRQIRTGRGVRGRIAALARVLDDADRWIARLAAWIAREGFTAPLLMVCAPMDAVAPQALVAPPAEDSS